MKLRNIAALIAAMTLGGGAYAQQPEGGRLIMMSYMASSDVAMFSQYDYTFGTARSAAMGGAFASLGADLSSLAINPAGLGMYRSSEFSISPSLTWTKSENTYPGQYYTNGTDNQTRFALGNMGIALNLYQSTGALTSFTFGFGYTKLADFNYRSNIGLDAQDISILDVFSHQANGTPAADFSTRNHQNPFNDLRTEKWGAAMAWQASAIDEYDEVDHLYKPNLWRDDDEYALTDNLMVNKTQGSLGQYDLAGGMNFNNIVYVGFSIGIQDLYYKQYSYYEEEYRQLNDPDNPMLRYMQYDQYVQYSGTGVNFKAGVIVRPIYGLRLGVAIHTPTWLSLDREYMATNFYTEMQDGKKLTDPVYSNYLNWRYEFTTPTRLLFGLSYQFEDFAILAADYEKVWYNGMRLGSSNEYYMPDNDRNDFKENVKWAYQGASNFRLGAEIRPLPMLALRVGYAYTGNPISSNEGVTSSSQSPVSYLDNPVVKQTSAITAGIGYRINGFSLDLAYANTRYDFTPYDMYWYHVGSYGGQSTTYAAEHPISSSMTRNTVTMTLGFRF